MMLDTNTIAARLPRRVLKVIHREWLFTPDARLVVAVSGGLDSIVLLHLLIGLRDQRPLAITAATFDHGLRGEAGAADATFVEATAQAWGVPCVRGAGAVDKEARAGVEAAARAARFAFLRGVVEATGAVGVALAHHADDQAETVLLHLLRGAGAARGMQPLTTIDGLTLIRPLLPIARADLEAYAAAHELEWREDATNRDTRFVRNQIRHETLPMLRRINPQVARSLGQAAQLAAQDDDYFADEVQKALNDPSLAVTHAQTILGGEAWAGWTCDRAAFVQLHPAIASRLLLYWLNQDNRTGHDAAADDVNRVQSVGYRDVMRAIDGAAHARHGAKIEFADGWRWRVQTAALFLERRAPLAMIAEPPGLLSTLEAAFDLPIGGSFADGDTVWTVSTTPPHDGRGALALAVPDGARLQVRGRRAGDSSGDAGSFRFAPAGMDGHTRKLKEWMIDKKISSEWRDRVPLLLVDGVIAAVSWHGWTLGEAFRSTPDRPANLWIGWE